MANKQDYLVRKEANKQKKLSAGVISKRYPKVSGIVLHMQYYQKASDKVYMVRTVNFTPSSYAYFKMDCLTKDCLNGGFELTPVIKDLIKKQKKSGKGSLVCKGKNESRVKGHVSISYEISIEYSRRTR
jgi:hypothetical protein